MSPVVADELRGEGVDVVWVGDWPQDPGDPAILARAYEEERVLVTLDNDFGELVVARKQPNVGVVRLVDVLPAETSAICRRVISFYARELAAGGIIVVEKGRTRVRERTNDA